MACANLWVAITVKRNRKCIFLSKIVSVTTSETFADVSLKIFTREIEGNTDVSLKFLFIKN